MYIISFFSHRLNPVLRLNRFSDRLSNNFVIFSACLFETRMGLFTIPLIRTNFPRLILKMTVNELEFVTNPTESAMRQIAGYFFLAELPVHSFGGFTAKTPLTVYTLQFPFEIIYLLKCKPLFFDPWRCPNTPIYKFFKKNVFIYRLTYKIYK